MEQLKTISRRLELMSHPGLNVSEIQELFDVKKVTARNIRKKALELGGELPLNRQKVTTKAVYAAMGLDLDEEIKRIKW